MMDERRLEGRYMCADLVHLDWLAGEDDYRSEQAVLEDISTLGGCVQLEEPVPLGAITMLTVGASIFYGHVCYCTHRDDGYFIGLRFSNDTTWSAGVVMPKHLTSLEQLDLRAQAQNQQPQSPAGLGTKAAKKQA
jgi:hypothetical protein